MLIFITALPETVLKAFDHFFPGTRLSGSPTMLGQTLVQKRLLPILQRNLTSRRGDAIPGRLHVVDLILDRQRVEPGRRQRQRLRDGEAWCSTRARRRRKRGSGMSRDLRLDHLDLYLVHFPIALEFVPVDRRYRSGWFHDPHRGVEIGYNAPALNFQTAPSGAAGKPRKGVMQLLRRLVGIPLVVVAAALASVVAEPFQTPAATSLTPEQMEAFLLKARVVRTRPTGIGVTNSQRATLTDGTLTHDAHVQVVDEFRAVYTTSQFTEVAFRDTYHYNIATYRLARLLGLDNLPVSVMRTVARAPASVTWWVDDVVMDEMERRKRGLSDPDPVRGNHYQYRMRVFDELIQNRDRNQGNVLYSSDWKMWLIDHTRAFRLQRTLGNAAILLRIERPLFERLQTLTPDVLAKALGPHLGRQGREALLARRDAIVAHFKARIAAAGEDVVLYTYAP